MWTSKFTLETTHQLGFHKKANQRESVGHRLWILDAVYMGDSHRLVVATMNRSLLFYETNTFTEEFNLFGLPAAANSLDYWYDAEQPGHEGILLYGDEAGSLHLLRFSSPITRLFEKPFSAQPGTCKVFMQDIIEFRAQEQCVRHTELTRLHPHSVLQVKFMGDADTVVSCSLSRRVSLLITDVHGKHKSYTFELLKGVNCFDLDRGMKVIATGSSDHLARLYNTYVSARPTAILRGHRTPVIALAIHAERGQLFTYSRDAFVKAWDLGEHTCLRTIALRFPTIQLGRAPEHGLYPILLAPGPHDALLVASNEYLAWLKLGSDESDTVVGKTSAATPLLAALYNPSFQQVVVSSVDGTVSVYDIESGELSLVMRDVHQGSELRHVSASERNLVTVDRSGITKVWSLQTGEALYELLPVSRHDAVTAAVYVPDTRQVVTVGWSRKIVTYDLSKDAQAHKIPPNLSWRGGQLHQADILTLDACAPSLLVTASSEGEIIVWSVISQKPFVVLQFEEEKALKEAFAVDEKMVVDGVLLLERRAALGYTNSGAILVSSQAGRLAFWAVHGQDRLLGLFEAVNDCKEDQICSLAESTDSDLLATGDTAGEVCIWNVADYCIKQDQVNTSMPPTLHRWRAHSAAVVGVSIAQFDTSSLIITASADMCAKLWTIGGELLGLFGQDSWNLKKLALYRTDAPVGGSDEKHSRRSSVAKEHEAPHESTDNVEGSHPLGPIPGEKCPEFQRSLMDVVDSKVDLGVKAERRLAEQKAVWGQRRRRFANIDSSKVFREELCTPYQALAIAELAPTDTEISFSSRMEQKNTSLSEQ
ncbi:PREDICTED: WD repeat-containing protein 49-like [Priapulus caudatus]|uniref:WD repeat-containing protein 49-like n=1 Tax=Priapulus caudatus TaxID=37621 RepID=A0ABM1EKV6_PRICU|nr:PREDICTED: WD repeat-containing protein 49-like [Priapulus caudatus]